MMRPKSTVNDSSSGEVKYRGVRRRKWGMWVSEVKLPNSRDRIWLGSYDSPEKAARAFDAAAFCLRGALAQLNFPDYPPDVPTRGAALTHQQIQEAAAHHANAVSNAPAPETNTAAHTNAPASETSSAVESIKAMDWPFQDSVQAPPWDCGYDFLPPWDSCYDFLPEAEDFLPPWDSCYDFLPEAEDETDDTATAEEGGCSSLWNF